MESLTLLQTPLTKITTCEDCGIALPLRLAADGETPEYWECTNCGFFHQGVLHEDARSGIKANVRPVSPKWL